MSQAVDRLSELVTAVLEAQTADEHHERRHAALRFGEQALAELGPFDGVHRSVPVSVGILPFALATVSAVVLAAALTLHWFLLSTESRLLILAFSSFAASGALFGVATAMPPSWRRLGTIISGGTLAVALVFVLFDRPYSPAGVRLDLTIPVAVISAHLVAGFLGALTQQRRTDIAEITVRNDIAEERTHIQFLMSQAAGMTFTPPHERRRWQPHEVRTYVFAHRTAETCKAELATLAAETESLRLVAAVLGTAAATMMAAAGVVSWSLSRWSTLLLPTLVAAAVVFAILTARAFVLFARDREQVRNARAEVDDLNQGLRRVRESAFRGPWSVEAEA